MTKEEIKIHISFSEYSQYKWCPYKWFLNYVSNIKEGANEFLVFGSALHKSIEEIILKNPNRFTYAKLFGEKLKAESSSIFAESYFGKTLGSDGLQLLNKLDFHSRFKNWEPNYIIEDNEKKIIGVEEPIYEPLVVAEDGTQLFFKGFIDFAAKHKKESKYMILDWKSSLKQWDVEKKQGEVDFKIINKKLKDNQELTLIEKKSLMSKIYFAQPVLYKHFYSLRHNVSLEDIIIRYCVLSRQPIGVDLYELQSEQEFMDYILNDVKKVALEIYEFKKTLNIDLNKAKTQEHLKEYCKYCKLKSDC